MSSSSHQFERLLSSRGPLAQRIQGFVPRPQQVEMAAMINDAIAAGENVLIEAGTGTGKTFAYLLPVLLSGQRAIVSTGSKNLQDQLFEQDLPVVMAMLEQPVSVALLKGRNNYLCPQRLEMNINALGRQAQHSDLSELMMIRRWWQQTTTGDLTELADIQSLAILPLITSTLDNCLGGSCPKIDECPVYRARSRAQAADLVVVNHHLLFADMVLQDEGFAALLPDVGTVVIDEAHQVVEIARRCFGERVSSHQLLALCRDIRAESSLLGNDDPLLLEGTSDVERMVSLLVDYIAQAPVELGLEQLLQAAAVRGIIEDMDLALGQLISVLAQAGMRSRTLAHCDQRARRLADYFTLLTEKSSASDDFIHWLEREPRSFTLHLSPVSLASVLSPHLNGATSWIMTSATLSVGREFNHFKRHLGLQNARERIFDSPFDFIEQVRGYIPRDLPLPGSDQHTRQLVHHCLPLIRCHAGRTFFLFTSYRALRIAQEILEGHDDLPILVQGSLAKPQLLARFRQMPGCILLATHSFWEGVDVRGADLRCLIIDKLPFSSPEDPVTAAQFKAIQAQGGNAFLEHAVPEAAIALKQGFGRLIRQESDEGLFVLGDPRVETRAYGRLFINSLPTMTWLDTAQDAMDYLDKIR